jgi:hypothetical protein
LLGPADVPPVAEAFASGSAMLVLAVMIAAVLVAKIPGNRRTRD